MVGLQRYWGERFGCTFLDDLSLRRSRRATGESVLEVYFWMAFGNAEVVSPSIAGSKVDKVDPKMAPTQP